MVLVEIPLWVTHGNPNAEKKKSILPTTSTTDNDAKNNAAATNNGAKNVTQIAKEASHVVALLVVSLPLTLLVPALARRRTATQKQKQKQKQTHQTNGTQQGTKKSNKKRH